MRVVLDTNVFLSGLLAKPGGTTREIREQWIAKRFEVYSSEYQILEIRRKLNQKFKDLLTVQERAELVRLIRSTCILIQPQKNRHLSKDPDDSPLVDIAIEAKAQFLVSGDAELKNAKHTGLKVVSPAEFLKHLR